MANLNPKLSARARAMPRSAIRKLIPLADGAKKKGIRVFHLNIGQPDVPSPAAFLKALGEYPDTVVAYGRSEGERYLREAYRDYYARFGISLDVENILVTTGGSEALLFSFFIVAEPGDEIIVFEPFYTNYNGFAGIADVKLVPVATDPTTGYHLPPASDIEAAVTPRTKAIVICSPNNPTGTVFTYEEMRMIAEIAVAHNLFVISDEVYREFVYDGATHTSMLSFPEAASRVVVTDSISKRFSACGARIGCLVSRNGDFLQEALKLCQARLSPPVIEEYAAAAALRLSPEEYVVPMIKKFESRRNVVYEAASQMPGVIVRKPAGAFYMMPKFPVDDAEKFVSWMLTDFSRNGATVMLAPGSGFYCTPGKGSDEARLAYVLNEDDLAQAMSCLAEGLLKYPGRKA